MFLADLTNRGNIPVLEKLMAYTEARHAMLADNVANLGTPGYKAKQLDPRAFQRALRGAIDHRGNTAEPLRIAHHSQFGLDGRGHLVVTPSEQPGQNILFHDRSNVRIEVLMASVAENLMTYNLTTEQLRASFDGLKTAIRGQI